MIFATIVLSIYLFGITPVTAVMLPVVSGIETESITSMPAEPVENFTTDITLKPFGIYITPETSPVQPERFSGYHTGVDVEIAEERTDAEISVYGITDGTVLEAQYVNGYGGAVAISHVIDDTEYVAIYGHLDIDSLTVTTGDTVSRGQILGLLGEGYSEETDGERMHLHFAVYRGDTVDWRGYVQSESELSKWIDPVLLYEKI